MRIDHDVVSGLALAGLSAGACVIAYRMGLGSMGSPAPGSIPFGIAALLGLMSLGLMAKGLVTRRSGGQRGDGTGPRSWVRPILVLVILTAYSAFFSYIGFLASTFLVMMALTWGVGRQKLLLSLTVSVLSAAAAYLLFVTVFGLPFPRGTIWPFMEG